MAVCLIALSDNNMHILGCKDTVHQARRHFFPLYSPSPGRFKNEQLNLINTELLTALWCLGIILRYSNLYQKEY